ncbi:cytochrome P450 [Enterococcus avium]|uniref:Cytochrome P450 n=1 Tax=Enterococcus avium TaxID=33945 RepID=A0A437USI2_ENTAV|nr:cytochrome P450 [Enterococcus avium]MDB1748830.1 cytochrome P450 [Enterococcus avium]MDB1752927.1 cytochrome P450 [Enterococcus avium]MDB1760008.1 cytochrome P450 [Enterococcus avium]MDY4026730.1 cytochrome P450 [Enterococcus avium]RVU96585.1 cytochrome P450 [Enterococcus avium]
MEKVPEIKIKLTDVTERLDEGYLLLSELRKEANAPVVKARLLNKEVIAIYGKEAAKKFYDPRNFKREGAMPKIVLKTLFGENGVQTLDGQAHEHRKTIFMDLMTPKRMEEYHRILDKNLTQKLDRQQGQFELFDIAKDVLFRSICEWAGIDLSQLTKKEVDQLAEYQISMISSAVTNPATHIKGIDNRKKSEKWAQSLIENARINPVAGKEDVALYAFAKATDDHGELLPIDVAAVELLNVIRPTVALTVWIALMGHALFSRPDIYQRLHAEFDQLQDSFIQEMRRYYPFFPMLPAFAIQDVEVDGYLIPKDSWVVLDLYGTNHDDRMIETPEVFRISRYLGKEKHISYDEEYEMIAQGGGKFKTMHRCAGEWITLHTLRVFSDQLVNKYQFSIPEQDWSIPMNQFPTYPKSKALLIKK